MGLSNWFAFFRRDDDADQHVDSADASRDGTAKPLAATGSELVDDGPMTATSIASRHDDRPFPFPSRLRHRHSNAASATRPPWWEYLPVKPAVAHPISTPRGRGVGGSSMKLSSTKVKFVYVIGIVLLWLVAGLAAVWWATSMWAVFEVQWAAPLTAGLLIVVLIVSIALNRIWRWIWLSSNTRESDD